jgi:hypothetical protein
MNHYHLEFVQHPAEEGERWKPKTRNTCPACGLKFLPFSNRFPVLDDQIERVHAGFWDWLDHPFVYVAGVVLVRSGIDDRLGKSGLGGFSFRWAEVSLLESGDEKPLPEYKWMVVEGRCLAHGVWERVVATCSSCGSPITERVSSNQRRIRLRETLPDGIDVARGLEDAVGVIVSERFFDFCRAEVPGIDDVVRFIPVPVEEE